MWRFFEEYFVIRSRIRSSRISLPCLLLLMAYSCNSIAAVEFPVVDCVISPYQIVDLASPVSGVIERVLVERSDYVKKGQVVAELAAGVERAAVALAKARAEVEPEINVWQINLNFDEKRKARIHSLYDKKVISDDNKDEADREAELSGWKLQQALDLKTIRQLELDRAEEQLQQKIIRSPIDGFVLERFRSAGEYIEDQPIVRIAQLDPLNVEAIVPIELFGKIPLGMAAEVHPETLAAETRPARVTVVDRAGDAGSGTFGVRLEMPNPAFELPSGLKCELTFLEHSEPLISGQPSSFSAAADRDKSIQSDPPASSSGAGYPRQVVNNQESNDSADSAGDEPSRKYPRNAASEQHSTDQAAVRAPEEQTSAPALQIATASASTVTKQFDATRPVNDYHPIRLSGVSKQPAAHISATSGNESVSPRAEIDEDTVMAAPKQSRRIGPILANEELEPIVAFLKQQQDITYKVTNSTSRQTADYIVVTEVFPTREALNAWVSAMRRQGVSDVIPLPDGDYRGRVSAGIFRNHSGAMRRKNRISELGYPCEIFERTKAIDVWWVDVSYSVNDAEEVTDLLRNLEQEFSLVARDTQVR